jgi:putative acetyltransferase
MQIREATESDLRDVLTVERAAFGEEDEAELVRSIMSDPSAEPALSLLAHIDGRAVGHILFTRAEVTSSPSTVTASILAPLAVMPEAQNQGIGGKLIEVGLDILQKQGTGLVFVLGYPEYYTRHGFEPAFPHDLTAPYPIPEKVSDAWMVQALRPGLLGSIQGQVSCCYTLNHPEYWLE